MRLRRESWFLDARAAQTRNAPGVTTNTPQVGTDPLAKPAKAR